MLVTDLNFTPCVDCGEPAVARIESGLYPVYVCKKHKAKRLKAVDESEIKYTRTAYNPAPLELLSPLGVTLQYVHANRRDCEPSPYGKAGAEDFILGRNIETKAAAPKITAQQRLLTYLKSRNEFKALNETKCLSIKVYTLVLNANEQAVSRVTTDIICRFTKTGSFTVKNANGTNVSAERIDELIALLKKWIGSRERDWNKRPEYLGCQVRWSIY